jgi:hypothetical protein
MKKSTAQPSSVTTSKEDLSTEEARYSALRNHRIRFEDAIDPNAERVFKVHNQDIVFGRGKGFQNHPGNQRMREIIHKYKAGYRSLKRTKKRELVQSIYDELTEGGARFLKKLDDNGIWVKVDTPIALQKVSHTLRCRKELERVYELDAQGVSKMSRDGVFNGSRGCLYIDPTQQAALQGIIPNSAISIAAMSPSTSLGPLAGGRNYPLMGVMDPLAACRLSSSFDRSIIALEAQRNAALQRYRALLTGVPAMGGEGMLSNSMALSSGMDRLNMIRRGQLLQEMSLMQHQIGRANFVPGMTRKMAAIKLR